MTVSKARKILGKLAERLSDEEIKKELEMSVFLAELILKEYPEYKRAINGK